MASGNSIFSIEAIHRISLPNLRSFWVYYFSDDEGKRNFILSLASLKKVNWPHLEDISISDDSSDDNYIPIGKADKEVKRTRRRKRYPSDLRDFVVDKTEDEQDIDDDDNDEDIEEDYDDDTDSTTT